MIVAAVIRLCCPGCGRFLAEGRDFLVVVCSACGAEVTYKSREERRRGPREVPMPGGPLETT